MIDAGRIAVRYVSEIAREELEHMRHARSSRPWV
jgi:hypothetical protein